MSYVQVWLKVPDDESQLPLGGPDDEPIKHPCLDREGSPISPTARLLGRLGAKNVQSRNAVFFVEDQAVWERLVELASEGDGTIAQALTKAVQQSGELES